MRLFINNLRWLFSREPLEAVESFEHLAAVANSPDRVVIYRELASLNRRVLALQRGFWLLSVGLGLVGLGDILRFVASMLS